MTILLQDFTKFLEEQPQSRDAPYTTRALAGVASSNASPGDPPENPEDDMPGADNTLSGSDTSEPEGGGTHSAVRVLMTRSKLAQAMKDVPKYKNILIIEDNQRDSDRLASTLRTIFGYDATVRQCRTLGTALDEVLGDQPELVFLDDRLGPVDKAEKSVPFLRSARYAGMILVISSFIDRRRRAEIMKLGVDEVIDKDDLDSTSICQALISSLARKRSTAT